jgi:hypothetical protein
MFAQALDETPALLLMRELWQFMTHGWVHYAAEQGVYLDTESISDYWVGMATQTIIDNDTPDTPGFDS